MENDLTISVHLGKQLNDLALTASRKRQSSQTSFVHIFYPDTGEDIQQTIPIVENTCFALALLRSKTSEQMIEAKDLLERLLSFQNPTEGNFPVYIHEYPICKDRFLGAQLLPLFFYILNEFHVVLGADLKQRLHHAVHQLLQYSLKTFHEKNPPYPIGIKIAAATKVLGAYFKDSLIEQKGSQLLDQYLAKGLQPSWFIPTSLADICTALQLAYSSIYLSPWKEFWQHLINTWHQPTLTYIGPGLKQYQQGLEPQATLYDLFLGFFSGEFPKRCLKDAAFHLHAVYIQPSCDTLPLIEYPCSIEGKLDQCRWHVYQNNHFAYSLIDQNLLHHSIYKNAFHPLSLIWGSKEKVHSFVCQEGNFMSYDFTSHDEEIDLNFQLDSAYNLKIAKKAVSLPSILILKTIPK